MFAPDLDDGGRPTGAGPRRPAARCLPTRCAWWAAAAGAAGAAAVRLLLALDAARGGDLAPLAAYGFTVVLPFVLVGFLLALGPGRTREGVLMRLGTAAQLILVMALPSLALHLVLGLPVVFLVVELFETRLPPPLREPVAARLVRC